MRPFFAMNFRKLNHGSTVLDELVNQTGDSTFIPYLVQCGGGVGGGGVGSSQGSDPWRAVDAQNGGVEALNEGLDGL
jgi:hypothetical protein